jgi:nitrile hydratase
MDGMHDLGGRQGFGAIDYTPNAAPYHAEWERRVNALMFVAVKTGAMNMDEYRHAVERMAPRHYIGASYYERMLTAIATMYVEKGLTSPAALRDEAGGTFPLALPAAEGRTNAPDRRLFQRGERVRVKNEHVACHVRMPGYIRGKTGVVVGESPLTPFPDAHAHGLEAEDELTYFVRFRSEDLWPNNAESALVHVSVFQSYLEPAG